MTSYVALLRGINVGGNKMISMAALREHLMKRGFKDVKTLLQSGNIVFRAPAQPAAKLEAQLEREIEKAFGMKVDFHVRTADEWQAIVDANPFGAEARRDPGRLLVTCFKAPLDKTAVTDVRAAITGPEVLHADGRHLYMVYPDGVGNSKAAAILGRKLPPGTARNWNTVLKLAALCKA